MKVYENLLNYACDIGAKVIEADLGINKPYGKCIGNIIIVNNRVSTSKKLEVLSEEIGHFKLTVGDITDQSNANNRKQELIARKWSYENIVTPEAIIHNLEKGVDNIYELAENLEITEEFLIKGLNHLKSKYGLYFTNKKYILTFDPLNIKPIK